MDTKNSQLPSTNKRVPYWQELEMIVADIQGQLAPDAVVKHNDLVKGKKTGVLRKLDVTVTQKVGTSTVLIVFDCKHHKRNVSIGQVGAFSEQLEDVGANLGVMISDLGFTDGAKKAARANNIILQIYRKAGETDWNELLGPQVWSFLVRTEPRGLLMNATLSHTQQQPSLSLDTQIFDENGQALEKIVEVIEKIFSTLGHQAGRLSLTAFFDGPPSFIRVNDDLLQIYSIALSGELVLIKHTIYWQFASGHIIENTEKTHTEYCFLASQGIDWQKYISQAPGVEITQDECMQIVKESKMVTDLRKAQRFIRIVARDKN